MLPAYAPDLKFDELDSPKNLLCLEDGREPERETPWRSNGVSGEEPAKVDHIEDVCEVLAVGLQSHIQTLRLMQVHSRRRVHLQGRISPSPGKIDAVEHLLPILCDHG